MIPETKAFCPRGLGIIPYQLPSSVELAEATIRELDDYDVVMWEKHGVFAVDVDVMAASTRWMYSINPPLFISLPKIWVLNRMV